MNTSTRRGKVLFQTLTIFLPLFATLLFQLKQYLSPFTYPFYIGIIFLLTIGFFLALIGFLMPLDLSQTTEERIDLIIFSWNVVHVYLPLFCLVISLSFLGIIFVDIEAFELRNAWIAIQNLNLTLFIIVLVIFCIFSGILICITRPAIMDRRYRQQRIIVLILMGIGIVLLIVYISFIYAIIFPK